VPLYIFEFSLEYLLYFINPPVNSHYAYPNLPNSQVAVHRERNKYFFILMLGFESCLHFHHRFICFNNYSSNQFFKYLFLDD
jgi:hypothetical protein